MDPRALGVILTLACGLLTPVGALSVFFTKKMRRLPFVGCLSFSAGVMIIISLVEMYHASIWKMTTYFNPPSDHPDDHAHDDAHEDHKALAYLVATVAFVFGWLMTWALDWLSHKIMRYETVTKKDADMSVTVLDELDPYASDGVKSKNVMLGLMQWVFVGKPHDDSDRAIVENADAQFAASQSMFLKLGIFTAFAFVLHNLPEGMAVYISSLSSMRIAVPLVIAVCLHNIPAGIAIAMPIYLGTNSKWKAFLTAFATGMTQPLGGLIGLAIASEAPNALFVGIVYGIVGGTMTSFALTELYRTSVKFDPIDQVSSRFLFFGVAVMATAVVLLEVSPESHSH